MSHHRETVTADGAPKAAGPYSHAVKSNGQLFMSGQVHLDPATGEATPLFLAFIAGQQRHLPAIMAILAPYVNSYRRIARDSGAPVNTQWGYDNRTCGLRVPPSDAANRRLENRIPSSDAACAATGRPQS